jgi:hypothetical protein
MSWIPESEWGDPATKGDLMRLESRLELQRQDRRLDRMIRRMEVGSFVMLGVAVVAALVALFVK